VRDLGIRGSAGDVDVRGIAYDSRRVEPGDLFVVWSGQRADGRVHARQAIEHGAVAVVAPGPARRTRALDVPWLEAREPRALLGRSRRGSTAPRSRADCWSASPAPTARHDGDRAARVLEAAGRRAASGQLRLQLRRTRLRGDRTTPEGSDLFRLLREMRAAGAGAVTMEVSSHALARAGWRPRISTSRVFLNLTRDHFDFHHDFEDYFAAKRRLFAS
jgi:UDP-N-acetylmuramoyl-L-alanyl-D-glutamate--2,6-diaminopimelate ligase